nr:hypothetical protein [Tanacetum cinerariifolium]
PDTLTNQAMKELNAYKTYYDFATGKVIPKPKYVRRSTRKKTDQAPKASLVEDDDDDNADDADDDDQDDDIEQTESDNDDDFVHPNLSTFDEEERHEEKLDKEEEEGFDQRTHTPSHFESIDDEAYDKATQGGNVKEENLDEEKHTKRKK